MHLLYAALALYGCGAAAGLAGSRGNRLWRAASFGLPFLGAVFGTGASLTALVHGTVQSATVATSVPLLEYSLRMDALSAIFNLALSLLGGAISIYSFGYVGAMPAKKAGVLSFFYN